jgi:hypothetical protein
LCPTSQKWGVKLICLFWNKSIRSKDYDFCHDVASYINLCDFVGTFGFLSTSKSYLVFLI